MPLIVISDSTAMCIVTQTKAGIYSTGLTLNGQDFIFQDSNNNVHVMPMLNAIGLSSGSVFQQVGDDEQTTVDVHIETTSTTSAALSNPEIALGCALNNTMVLAEVIINDDNSASARCFITNDIAAGTYSVAVRLIATGQNILSSSKYLIVHPTPIVTKVEPEVMSLGSTSYLTLTGVFSSPHLLKCCYLVPGASAPL
jgi:hypothetical protein